VSNTLSVEATGETVGEAKWHALRELEKLQPGLDKAAVVFTVVSEGERGILGVGYAPARVVATVGAEQAAMREVASVPPADESELAAVARAVLERVTRALGIGTSISVSETEDEIVASCSGGDLGLLIGKHGQTIDALQYLLNAILFRAYPEQRKPVVVDAAGYRERRRATLDAIAHRSAKQAVTSGRRVELEPMTAVERKVVHESLKSFEGVTTTSEGTEPNRFVVIVPEA
jgi:spoIIIJ-associated protein